MSRLPHQPSHLVSSCLWINRQERKTGFHTQTGIYISSLALRPWTMPLAFLAFQLADNKSQSLSASTVVWTSSFSSISFCTYIYLLLVLFVWRTLILHSLNGQSLTIYLYLNECLFLIFIKCLFLFLPELFLSRTKSLGKERVYSMFWFVCKWSHLKTFYCYYTLKNLNVNKHTWYLWW